MSQKQLMVSSSPHIKSDVSTSKIMTDVVIALIPALVCAVYFFGMRSLYLVAVSVIACVAFEYLWQKILKKPITISDGTAVVTGVLLAFNVPATLPWWTLVVGAFVAIIIAKQFYGGTGNNFINPALAGRAFMLASWPTLMTRWTEPFSIGFSIPADLVSSATPLALLKGTAEGTLPDFMTLFLGNIGGSIGETSVLALLLGGLYLMLKKVIRPTIPVMFIGTVALLFFFFPGESYSPIDSMIYHVLSGGLFLGAIFMATDYTTSPITTKGQVIMGLSCGILTFLIRRFGDYPEGVSYAILLMNIATPLIDKATKPRTFGLVKGEA